MDEVSQSREDVIQAATSLLSSRLYGDMFPTHAHVDHEIEMKTMVLDEAVVAHARALGRTTSVTQIDTVICHEFNV